MSATNEYAFPSLNAEMTGIDSDGIERFDIEPSGGMTLHDYAAIRFAAAWTVALGSKEMSENHREQAWEANRLGRMQADDFMVQRGLASQPDTQDKK
jgi:hypothetical protein